MNAHQLKVLKDDLAIQRALEKYQPSPNGGAIIFKLVPVSHVAPPPKPVPIVISLELEGVTDGSK